jgi:ribosomal protein S6--L-glutamate ligase
VLAVGPALGLTVYGVDLRIHDDRPVIVDVNGFPGFRGLPSAVPALLDTIRARLFNESQVAS